MPKYIVQDMHIRHGAQGEKKASIYAPGDEIELTQKEAEKLGSNVKPSKSVDDIEMLTVDTLKKTLGLFYDDAASFRKMKKDELIAMYREIKEALEALAEA